MQQLDFGLGVDVQQEQSGVYLDAIWVQLIVPAIMKLNLCTSVSVY